MGLSPSNARVMDASSPGGDVRSPSSALSVVTHDNAMLAPGRGTSSGPAWQASAPARPGASPPPDSTPQPARGSKRRPSRLRIMASKLAASVSPTAALRRRFTDSASSVVDGPHGSMGEIATYSPVRVDALVCTHDSFSPIHGRGRNRRTLSRSRSARFGQGSASSPAMLQHTRSDAGSFWDSSSPGRGSESMRTSVSSRRSASLNILLPEPAPTNNTRGAQASRFGHGSRHSSDSTAISEAGSGAGAGVGATGRRHMKPAPSPVSMTGIGRPRPTSKTPSDTPGIVATMTARSLRIDTHGLDVPPTKLSPLTPSPLRAVATDRRSAIQWKKADLLGAGRGGRVYLALNEMTGGLMVAREVRTKDTRYLRRLAARVTDVLVPLKHPSLVPYLGVSRKRRKLYVFAQYQLGGSLRVLLDREHTLPEAAARTFIKSIVLGLAFLHSSDVAHGSLQPSNVWTDGSGNVMLSDFGMRDALNGLLARQRAELDAEAGTAAEPDASTARGDKYDAPEVAASGESSAAGDVWSLGCLVLAMLTGSTDSRRLDAPGAMSPQAVDFVRQCRQVDPASRPPVDRLITHSWLDALNGSGSSSRVLGEKLFTSTSMHAIVG